MVIYRLSKETLLAGILGLTALTLVVGGALLAEWISPVTGLAGVRPDLVLALAVVGFLWFEFLHMPYLILIHEDKTAEFRSLLKRTRLSLKEIESAELLRLSGLINLRHTEGSLHLFYEGHASHLVITALKNVNPKIRIIGFSF